MKLQKTPTTLGPAAHSTGDQLRPGDLVTAIKGVKDVSSCVDKSGQLKLPMAPPFEFQFKRNWRPVDDGAVGGSSHSMPSGPLTDGNSWIVKTIRRHREGKRETEFLVEWEGYDANWEKYRIMGSVGDPICTWEPEENIEDPLLIRDYWKRSGKAPKQPVQEEDDGEEGEDCIVEPMTQPTAHAATGRPAKRQAKFPSKRLSGALTRRGKKPCKRRPEQIGALEVPLASLDIKKRVAQCKARLLQPADADAIEAAEERIDCLTYVE